MFAFDEIDLGSRHRYLDRLYKFQHKYGKTGGWLRYHFWWYVHNCIAHNIIGYVPFLKAGFTFHDYTSRKINLK